jgi:hypothetical protein
VVLVEMAEQGSLQALLVRLLLVLEAVVVVFAQTHLVLVREVLEVVVTAQVGQVRAAQEL